MISPTPILFPPFLSPLASRYRARKYRLVRAASTPANVAPSLAIDEGTATAGNDLQIPVASSSSDSGAEQQQSVVENVIQQRISLILGPYPKKRKIQILEMALREVQESPEEP